MDLSIIIVTYNSSDDIGNIAEDIRMLSKGLALEFEVLVWDNASSDDTVERAGSCGFTVQSNGENLGFARAVNILAARAAGKSLLLLNPDCRTGPDVVSTCLAHLAAEGVGAVSPNVKPSSPRTMIPGGRLPTIRRAFNFAFFLSRLLPRVRWFEGVYCYYSHDDIRRLEWLAGTSLFVARDTFDGVGGLSERWFMYGEDVDFGRRLKREGLTSVLLQNLHVRHREGASFGAEGPKAKWVQPMVDCFALDGRGRLSISLFSSVMAVGYALRAVLSRNSARRQTMWVTSRAFMREARVGYQREMIGG